MAPTLDLLHEAAILVIRQATTTTPTSVYNPYSTTTSSASTASMSAMPVITGGERSFFEKYKMFIIGAAIGIPLQIAGGWFYIRRRKQKKAAAALEKENLEIRLKELEMGVSGMKPAPMAPVFGRTGGYE